MQSQPLLRRSQLAALGMLLSPSSSSCLNPNLHLTFRSPLRSSPKESLNLLPSISLSYRRSMKMNLPTSQCYSTATATMAASRTPELENAEIGPSEPSQQPLLVVSFYKFAHFPDHADMRKPLKDLCQRLRVSGGIILAAEGINGSICGTPDSVDEVLTFIQSDNRLKGLKQVECPVSPEEEAIHHGHSSSSPLAAGEDVPFRWDHVRVKLKKEIVSLGMPTVSPIERVGKYVSPKDWNELISDPDTVVIDVRNGYETRIGKFQGAVDPCTTAFREFPSWVEKQFQLAEAEAQVELNDSNGSTDPKIMNKGCKKLPRVAMYCTGGIRCEKASSLLLGKGFGEVYHLEGGILKYLEEIPKVESKWDGECFVFDKRVSVDHGLEQGTFKLCYGCKQPVSDADMETPEWEYGVTCPYCYSSKSEEEKERARARQRQFETWGVIGGPDKGQRSVAKTSSVQQSTTTNLSKSV